MIIQFSWFLFLLIRLICINFCFNLPFFVCFFRLFSRILMNLCVVSIRFFPRHFGHVDNLVNSSFYQCHWKQRRRMRMKLNERERMKKKHRAVEYLDGIFEENWISTIMAFYFKHLAFKSNFHFNVHYCVTLANQLIHANFMQIKYKRRANYIRWGRKNEVQSICGHTSGWHSAFCYTFIACILHFN